METQEKLQKISEVLETYLLGERGKYSSEEEFIKENEWILGVLWAFKFAIGELPHLEFDKNQSETILKSRPLYEVEQIQQLKEIIVNSHLGKVRGDLIVQRSGTSNSKDNICKNCIYAKNKRPDGIKMLPVNVWCTRIRKEMPQHLSCNAGKWGFF